MTAQIDKHEIRRSLIIFSAFLLFVLATSFWIRTKGQLTTSAKKRGAKGGTPSLTQRLGSPERAVLLQPARVVETLNIKPGMAILDIGSGLGLFTYHFAEALKRTGEVFATDVEPRWIEYLKEKTAEKKYENVFPVLVKREGVDPFYKQHSFDIIFLCNVYYLLWHHEDYFRELRPSLKKNGRLYILQPKNDYDFSESMFGDFKQVNKILNSMGEDSPIFQRLNKKIQYFIKGQGDGDIPPEMRRSIVQDLNKLLSDRFLANDLLDYYAEGAIPPWDTLTLTIERNLIPLTKWLMAQLDNNGVFDRQKEDISDADKKALRMLNRILLTAVFSVPEFLWYDLHLIAEKDSVITTLERAGYRLVREYDFLRYHHFLEFERRD